LRASAPTAGPQIANILVPPEALSLQAFWKQPPFAGDKRQLPNNSGGSTIDRDMLSIPATSRLLIRRGTNLYCGRWHDNRLHAAVERPADPHSAEMTARRSTST
jgi:hypothetical protein